MMERSSDTPPTLSATPHEAHVWLLQTQYPELTLKQVTVWRLNEAFERSRLEAALGAVIDSLPALNARYRFDEEGDLLKLAGQHWRDCVQVWQVSGETQARERLLALQARPWEPAGEPPFAALIVETGDSLLLAFVLHPVLDPVCRADDLYRMTLNAYAGQPVGQPNLPWLEARREASHADAQVPAAAPQTSSQAHVEALILDEFRQALAEPGMTANDDFFDFGGHSLLATRIVGRLAGTHGVQVRFNDFFSASSAAALAARAQRAEAGSDDTAFRSSDDVAEAPFAPAQASLGRAYQAFDFGTIFKLPFAMEFLEPVDEAVLEQAFTDLVQRHASLRTTYHFDTPTPCQRQVPIQQLGQYTWFWSSLRSQGVTLASEAAHCFDLSRELPLRVRVLRDPRTGHQQLSLLVHHMAIDEWSLNVMMQELAQAYAARAADRVPVWAAPAPAFQAYAQQASARGIDPRHLAYWTDLLRDVTPGLQLPAVTSGTEASIAPAQGAGSTDARWFEIQTDQATVDGLHTFARQNDASLFGVLYTGIALALHKVGDLRELVIGTSASGRTDPAYYDTVGYFTTMVAHPVRFEPRQPVGELIEGVSRLINDSMAYADVPMEQIQQALGRTPEQGLLFDVYIQIHASNALNGALSTPAGEAIPYRQIDPDKSQSMFGIQFEILENVLDGKRSLRLVVTYLTARYSEAQMACVRQAIERVFAAFTRDETAALSVQHVMA